MIKLEVLDAMAAAGCSAEQIVAAIRADRGEISAGAMRQARYRAAKKEREAANSDAGDVTLRNGDASDVTRCDDEETVSLSPVPLLSPTPPNNPLTPNPIPKSKPARGCRLPKDWVLTGADLAYALSKGLSEPQTINLFERFCSWAWAASGPNAVKRNWHQAWQGWVLREVRDRPKPRAGPGGIPEGKGGFVSVLMERHLDKQNGTSNFDADEYQH